MTVMYRRKVEQVEALQHDGTEDSAIRISNWVNLHGDQSAVIPMNSEEGGFDKHFAYVRFLTKTPRGIVAPGSWVVKLAEGVFYTLTSQEFFLVYEQIPDIPGDSETMTNGKEESDAEGSTYA